MGFERSDSAVAVLGMEGFVLLAAVEVNGELHQLVETQASVVGCSGCGTRALSKGRRRTKVRDLSCGGRPVVVVWSKRLWRCGDADCDVKTWSETSPLIAARASLTERARVGPIYESGARYVVAVLGEKYGVKRWTIFESDRFKSRIEAGEVVPIWSSRYPRVRSTIRKVGGLSFDPSGDLDPQARDAAGEIVKMVEDRDAGRLPLTT